MRTDLFSGFNRRAIGDFSRLKFTGLSLVPKSGRIFGFEKRDCIHAGYAAEADLELKFAASFGDEKAQHQNRDETLSPARCRLNFPDNAGTNRP